MRAFTAAAVQLAPVAGPLTAESVAANVAKCAAYVRDCVAATGAELVVLPESATTGFTPGIAAEALGDELSEVGVFDGNEPAAAVLARETPGVVCAGDEGAVGGAVIGLEDG